MRTLARIEDRGRILGRLSNLTAAHRARWGRLNAREVVCHLADSFRVGLDERQARPAENVFTRTLVKWIGLYGPVPWPHGVPTRPEVDPHRQGTRPFDFAADHAALRELLERFSAPNARLAPRHPIFGPMSRDDWQRWGYLHMDHHLRQFGA